MSHEVTNNLSTIFYLKPIIGQITETSVELLINPVVSVNLHLFDYVTGRLLAIKNIEPEGEEPQNISLVIKPSSKYKIQWVNEGKVKYVQYFTNLTPKKFIFVSCDYPLLDTSYSLWNTMKNFEDKTYPETVVHLGDNIYGDIAFHQSMAMLKEHEDKFLLREEYPNYNQELVEQIESYYNSCYINNFNNWSSLSSFTNHLLFPDDHDITNNANELSQSPDEKVQFVYDVARDCIRQYQESLLKDKDYGTLGWYQIYELPNKNKTLLYVFHRLGLGQQKYTSRHLDQLETLMSTMDHVIICFTTAPIPRPPRFYQEIYSQIFGTDGLWTDDEVYDLYDFCDNWLAGNSKRKCVLVGGDIHIGATFEITRARRTFPVLVTGPVTNHPSIAEYCYAFGLRKITTLRDFQVNPYWVSAKRNYFTYEIDDNNNEIIETHKSNRRWPRRLRNLYTAYHELTGNI